MRLWLQIIFQLLLQDIERIHPRMSSFKGIQMLTLNGKPSAVISPQDLLDARQPPIILDCRTHKEYDYCHIDGAIHVDAGSMLSPEIVDPARGGRNPLPSVEAWEQLLQLWGVQPDSLVVAYDEATGADAAARAWWMLTASGVRASILDGGWNAAMRARLPVNEEAPPQNKPSTYKFNRWMLPTVDIETVDKLRCSEDWLLLDTRSPERWRGKVELVDPVAGCIPGSKNLFYKENLDVNGYFKTPEELREMYLKALGGLPPTRLIASCGSGMTACHTLLALHQAGLEGASLYVGSYSEWCRNKKDCLPIRPK